MAKSILLCETSHIYHGVLADSTVSPSLKLSEDKTMIGAWRGSEHQIREEFSWPEFTLLRSVKEEDKAFSLTE